MLVAFTRRGGARSWARIVLSVALALAVVTVAVLALVRPVRVTSTPRAITREATNRVWSVAITLASTSVRAGQPIEATFVVTNLTRRAIEVGGCAGQQYVIYPTDGPVHNQIIEPSNLCSYSLSPGSHVTRAEMPTTYMGCGEKGVPSCGEPPRMSALPAGTYTTTALLPLAAHAGDALPNPGTFRIRLTR